MSDVPVDFWVPHHNGGTCFRCLARIKERGTEIRACCLDGMELRCTRCRQTALWHVRTKCVFGAGRYEIYGQYKNWTDRYVFDAIMQNLVPIEAPT